MANCSWFMADKDLNKIKETLIKVPLLNAHIL